VGGGWGGGRTKIPVGEESLGGITESGRNFEKIELGKGGYDKEVSCLSEDPKILKPQWGGQGRKKSHARNGTSVQLYL